MVLGRGRLGRSLAGALDVPLVAVRQHGPGTEALLEALGPLTAESLVILAVPDQWIPAFAARLGRHLPEGAALVHLSGASTLEALVPAARRGSLHPLQSFPSPKPPEHFHGITAAVDASDPELLAELEAVARRLGATPRRVTDAQRLLYHAAAVLAGNDLVALAATAVAVLESLGWEPEQALAALLPLQRGTLENLERDGLPDALIGPVRRGDHATVARQLAALRAAPGLESPADVYRILGQKALDLARRAGLDEEAGRRISEALTD